MSSADTGRKIRVVLPRVDDSGMTRPVEKDKRYSVLGPPNKVAIAKKGAIARVGARGIE